MKIKNKPADELLAQYAPLDLWRKAEKEAMRSTHYRHKTGCVIAQIGRLGALSTGTSHTHGGEKSKRTFSVHSEAHAISRLPPDHGGAYALIVTLTKNGNYAGCSRPCEACAKLLSGYTWGATWAEICNDGSWAIHNVTIDQLLSGYLKPAKLTGKVN